MKHIILDCDCTVGLPGKPMDDANLAACRAEMYNSRQNISMEGAQ